MTAAVIIWLTKFITGASVRWAGCDPVQRQRVYFANHTSHLDGVVLWSALPPSVRKVVRPVAAADYWMAGPIRKYLAMRVFNAILITREHVSAKNNPLTQILNALDAKSSIIIFPEGHRNDGGEPGEFKSGLYHIMKKRPDIEFIPVYIDNMNRILPRGEFLPVPLLTCISFGAPINVAKNESKEEFLLRARKSVNDLRQA